MPLGQNNVIIGVLVGVTASAVALTWFDGRGPDCVGDHSAVVLSDCDGHLNELVIHYVPEAAKILDTVYREFLTALPAEVKVHVVCSRREDFDHLMERMGPCRCELSPIAVQHPITCWARDRWLALAAGEDAAGRITILTPRGEDGADIWPARRGDELVGRDLAARLAPRAGTKRSDLFFDGGDFVSDTQTVFVTPAVLLRNLQRTVATDAELRTTLETRLGRRVLLLQDAPSHHAGMFMMTVGDGTVLVGDPSAAFRLLQAQGAENQIGSLFPHAAPDSSSETQAQFDTAAAQCRAAGYRVVRIPTVPGTDGRTYLSYVNVILDERGGRRTVYLPVFRGAEVLNDAAEQTWQALGYEVCRIDCTDCYPHFGTLRCLVNVLRRS